MKYNAGEVWILVDFHGKSSIVFLITEVSHQEIVAYPVYGNYSKLSFHPTVNVVLTGKSIDYAGALHINPHSVRTTAEALDHPANKTKKVGKLDGKELKRVRKELAVDVSGIERIICDGKAPMDKQVVSNLATEYHMLNNTLLRRLDKVEDKTVVKGRTVKVRRIK
jgi:hypothetical protein